ncbi:MAG: choice-of-anchor Q domain-containing protein [Bergeyella sp.]
MKKLFNIIHKALLLLMVVSFANTAFATVYNVTNTSDGTATNQLRGAIMAADAAGGTHTINVAAGTYNLTMGQIQFGNTAQNISIVGVGSGQTIINMTTTNQNRIFAINYNMIANVNTTITGVKFTNGYLTNDYGGGGAILWVGGNSNSITITNCVFEGNKVDWYPGGGALRMAGGGIVNIDQCSFINNQASDISTNVGARSTQGGAVYIDYYGYGNTPVAGSASITNCSFTGNNTSADYDNGGGALCISALNGTNAAGFSTVVQNNTFNNNTVSDCIDGGKGGAIYVFSDFPVTLNYNSFSGNTIGGTTKEALYVGNSVGDIDATNNWWGCNTDPQASGTCSEIVLHDHNSLGTGIVTTQPQLVLKTEASTNTLCPNGSTVVTASVLQNSAGTTMSLANVSRLIGMPLTFSATNGTISNAQTTIQANGKATATYTATTAGTGSASALAGYLTAGDALATTSIVVGALPAITSQPVSVLGCPSGTTTMSVTATGTGLTYQWYKGTTALTNNSVISGATTATLTFTNPTAADAAANYKVVVTGTCGTTTSSEAALTVYGSRLYVATGGTGSGSSWSDALGDLHTALTAAAGCGSISEIFVAKGTYDVGSTSFIMKNGVAIYGGFDPDNGITDLTHSRIMPNAANLQGSVLNGQGVRPVIWNVFTSATAMDNTAVLDGFTIYNGSYTYGAGIRNVYASPTLRNLVIRGNGATAAGAGMYNDNSSPLISNTVISNNIAANATGNVYGAGISNNAGSSPVIINTTITENKLITTTGTMGGAGVYNNGSGSAPVIYNSIIWNNQKNSDATVAGADIENNSATLTLKNSITQLYTTGSSGDNNLVGSNPLFSGTDFQLSDVSPAINAGSNAWFTGLSSATKDLAGNLRLSSQNIDMGAYEFQTVIIPDANGIVYVKPSATGNGTGNSWANATSELKDAINGTGTQKVYVATGNYSVGSSSFVMKNGVEIYGGFNPVDNTTDWTTRTIPTETVTGSVLNGENTRPAIYNDNNGLTATALLDGFTLMNGYGNHGGAMYNINVSPTFNNLVIKNSTAATSGGGIYNVYAPITLSNTIITNNTAQYGGGVRNNNSNSEFTNVIIKENTATLATGGAGGGGIFNENSALKLTNVLISGNSTQRWGGGIRNLSGNPVLTNVTIANNAAPLQPATAAMEITAGTPEINNSIIYGTVTGAYTPQYSLIEGNTGTANGNIDATGITTDYVFTDYANGDYTLKAGSPAINAGSNALNATSTDLAGNERVYNSEVIDMGAYESSYMPITPANGIVYVKTDGTGTGSSWDDATADLHNAIHTFGVQKVFVEIGTYNVGSTSFIMKNGVEIYGGFDPDNGITDLTHNRILPSELPSLGGVGGGSILNGQAVRPVVWNVFTSTTAMDNTAVLDGFTLYNGRAVSSSGGGMRNEYASPTLKNLVFRDNKAGITLSYGGGAMYNFNSSPIISNSIFANSSLTAGIAGRGGAVYNDQSSPTFDGCLFTGNYASIYGSVMYNTSSSVTVSNSIFRNNTAERGTIYANGGSLTMTNCAITDNTAYLSYMSGEGNIYLIGGTNTFTNVTTANNGNSGVKATTSLTLNNSIIWDNLTGTYTANYSLIQGSSSTASGNIDATGITAADIFTDPTNGDYTLKSGSPAINAGSNSLNTTTTDLAGNARVYDTVIDLGAYEYLGGTLSAVSVLKDKLLVYPNPVKEILYFSEEVSNIRITDLSGRTVKQISSTGKTVDVSNLANGVYIVTAVAKSGETVARKIVKE